MTDEGLIRGVNLGKNTLEGFANRLRNTTEPPISPTIIKLKIENKPIIAVTTQQLGEEEVIFTLGSAYIRIGKTNQKMTPSEIKTRLTGNKTKSADISKPPIFEFVGASVTCSENMFIPHWTVKKMSGDYVPSLEWRFRGPRFYTEWQPDTESILTNKKRGIKSMLSKLAPNKVSCY